MGRILGSVDWYSTEKIENMDKSKSAKYDVSDNTL
jgi:hypothetical protein